MTEHPEPSQALTFVYSYRPEASFQVVDRLPQVVVDRILGREVDGEPVIADTADYDAYLATYRSRDVASTEHILVFVDGSLREGQQYTFGTDAVFFASHLGLIEVDLSTDDGGTPTPKPGGSGDGNGSGRNGGNDTDA